MLNRLLLLCPLILLLFSCSDNDADNQPNTSLSDTCLITRLQFDSLNYASIKYDTLSFLPLSINNNGKVSKKFSYSNNQYTIITFNRNESDTFSIDVFTLDSDKKVVSIFTRRKNTGNSDLLSYSTCEYNPDKTIKSIRVTSNNPNLLSSEQRFGWINGNLTSDSSFIISNFGTPREEKGFFKLRLMEYNNFQDLKGVGGLYFESYQIPNLFGKGPRNLVSKTIEDPGFTTNNETIITYLFNNKGWPTEARYSGKFNGQKTYTYTCYMRK